MLKVRTTKTASGGIAVQVIYRHHQKTEIVKHIGTAINAKGQKQLVQLAHEFIATNNKIPPLFPEVFTEDRQRKHVVAVEDLDFTHAYYTFAHEFLSGFYALLYGAEASKITPEAMPNRSCAEIVYARPNSS